jgi:hypothetical protein
VIWISGIVCAVALVSSTAYAGVRGWRCWRLAKDVSGRASAALAQVEAGATRAEQRAVELSAGTERLQEAVARLQGSLAELAVLRASLDESRRAYRSLRAALPGK